MHLRDFEVEMSVKNTSFFEVFDGFLSVISRFKTFMLAFRKMFGRMRAKLINKEKKWTEKVQK